MAGRKQHIIPKSFLKEFVTPAGNDKLWLYRKTGDGPILVPRSTTARKKYFYSKPRKGGNLTLDDNITAYEGGFALKLQKLRNLNVGDNADSLYVAEILTHLIVRNRHTRSVLHDGISQMLQVFIGPAPDIDILPRLSSREVGTEVRQALEEAIVDNNLEESTGLHQDSLVKIGHFYLREQLPKRMPQIQSDFDAFINTMQEKTPGIATGGHQKALEESLTPETRVSYLSNLSWVIEDAPPGGAILPDCIALGLNQNNDWIPVILGDHSNFRAIVAPLAKDRFLVGRINCSDELDLGEFNKWAAAASFEFFWSHRIGEDLDQISSKIGLGSKNIMKDLISNAVSDIESDKSECHPELSPPDNDVCINKVTNSEIEQSVFKIRPFSGQASFTNISSRETADKITECLKYIIGKFSEKYHIDRLDGVTFASDYEQALIDLDRGFDTNYKPEPTKTDYGVGVSMTLCIKRDGIIKWRIIAQDWIGHDLISEDDQDRSQAAGIIWGMLANVASGQLFDDAFPAVMLNPLPDEYENIIYGYANNVFDTYFSSRLSAIFYLEETENLADMLVMALRQASELIPASRYSYRYHGDLDKFFGSAVNTVREILILSARVLGVVDGRDEKIPHSHQLNKILEEHELVGWFELFHADVRHIFDNTGNWSSFDQFLILNRHLERLLWSFGIIPERNDSGGLYVHVPLSTDAERLLEENLQ